jgi:hypothetical protein
MIIKINTNNENKIVVKMVRRHGHGLAQTKEESK